MSDDRQATDGEAERVGYGRPPKHTQFQKGNRAYLHRRGARDRDDFAESVRSTLTSKVRDSRRRPKANGDPRRSQHPRALRQGETRRRGGGESSHRPVRSLGQGRGRRAHGH